MTDQHSSTASASVQALVLAAMQMRDALTGDGDPPSVMVPDGLDSQEFTQIFDSLATAINSHNALARLVYALSSADEKDWVHLLNFIPESGHGKFWKAVFAEVRAALSQVRP